MTAVYAQKLTRRYLTVVGGEVTYCGEERLDGMSVGRDVGRHDLWIDSLDEAAVSAALRGLTGGIDVPREVLARMSGVRACPANVAAACRSAAALGAASHVRFEFELLHRRGLVLSPEVPDGVWVDHGGVRCRVVVESPRGVDRGRAYTQARSHDVADLDLAAAVADAEFEAAGITCGERLPAAGRTPVLLSPAVAAALLHETCGHALEADVSADGGVSLADNSGDQLAAPSLTVLDEPARTDLWGGYSHDDEGRVGETVPLLDAGRVGQALRDERTRGVRGSNGHGRRSSHQRPSVPRMSNVVVVPGTADEQVLLDAGEGGYYLHSIERAKLVPRQETVLLHARLGHRIRHGERAEPIAGLVIKGRLRDLLAAVSLVGRERAEFSGYCAKASQRIPFGALSPHLLLSEVQVIPY